jgi:phosphatidylglycerophosphate synthase
MPVSPTLVSEFVATPAASDPRGPEVIGAVRHPLSRWWLLPAAARLAESLAPTGIRPTHITLLGLVCAAAAAVALALQPESPWLAAPLVLAAWFCDRVDGLLARLQRTASAWGGWLDANVDELCDIGMHAAVAWAATAEGSLRAWGWFAAFVAGKYLFTHGLGGAPAVQRPSLSSSAAPHCSRETEPVQRRAYATLRALYHLPGNADVRIHLLAAALATGWLEFELAAMATYYHARWLARYGLVWRRLRGGGA